MLAWWIRVVTFAGWRRNCPHITINQVIKTDDLYQFQELVGFGLCLKWIKFIWA
jgi:hypothetical protein